MQRDVKAIVDGGLGGALGTATMSVVMGAARWTGLVDRLPPEEIADRALDAGGVHDRGGRTRDAVAVAGHLGFGAVAGALFGVLHRRLPPAVNPLVHGALFGSLVWAVSYKGWIPALGIMPPPEHDHPARPVTMLLAHWVYGATLGLIVDRRLPRRR